MKNYKFRAWDNHNKKWLMGYEYPNLGGFSLTGESVLFGEWGDCFDEFVFEKNGKKADDLIITQFTGLVDRNNKQLYDGDIVKFRANYTSKPCGYMKGILRMTEFELQIEAENGQFYSANNETDEFPYADELIGNIFDNPELCPTTELT